MDAVGTRIPNILLFIGQGAEEYRREKLRRILRESSGGVEPDAEQLAGIQIVSNIPIAAAAQLPLLTDKQQAEANLRSKCLLESVDRISPLLDGEKIEEDFFSYLTAPFEHLSACTVLLRRRTNLGELYYIVQNVGITPQGELVPHGSALPAAPQRMMLSGPVGSFAVKMGKSLATGLASAVGGAIAGAIWDLLFPPGVPDYFNQVYEEISRRLRADVAVHIKGALGNIQNAISAEYRPRRANADLTVKAQRDDLSAKLNKYDLTFLSGSGGMMGTLMDPSYAQEAFPVFLLGAGLQLALYQEMATVDPLMNAQNKFPSPLESSYGQPRTGTTAITAKRLSAHARQTWAAMLDKRGGAIPIKEWTYTWSGMYGAGGSERHISYYDGNRTIEDVALNYKDSGKNDQLKREVSGRHQAYKQKMLAQFVDEYQHPETVYAEWEKLIDHPILLAAGAPA